MPHRVAKMGAVLVAALLLAGADRAPAALQGTWIFDAEKMIELQLRNEDGYKKASLEERRRMEEYFRTTAATAAITFSGDRIRFRFGETEEEAQFRILSRDGDRWTIESTERKKDGSSVVETATIEWADDDHMALATDKDPGEKIYLVRRK